MRRHSKISPETTIMGFSSASAIIGLGLVLGGISLENPQLVGLGKYFLAPIIVVGLVTVFVVLPVLFWANSRSR